MLEIDFEHAYACVVSRSVEFLISSRDSYLTAAYIASPMYYFIFYSKSCNSKIELSFTPMYYSIFYSKKIFTNDSLFYLVNNC
ncbi:hypothetical protein YC2023_085157 [Brassica napus]